MISAELLQTIRYLDLCTRRLLHGYTSGNAPSMQRGFGFEFDTLDDYQEGDDVRYIDHLRSAQRDTWVVRRYRNEPSRTVVVLYDSSGSSLYGTSDVLISSIAGHIATTIALAAAYRHDNVGGMLFADKVHTYLPPRCGKRWALACAEKFLSQQPAGTTSLTTVAEELMSKRLQRSLIILISDCIDEYYQQALRMLLKRNEVVVIRLMDHYDTALPLLSFFTSTDGETGNGLSALTEKEYKEYADTVRAWYREQDLFYAAHAIDCLTLMAADPWHDAVINFFEKRRTF
jgi:uncharacterized protein (DUF58 family)